MNSVLNPEAPEFYPHISSFTQGAYTSINKTIRSSNRLPSGAKYDFFKTFTDFNIVTCQLSESVIFQSNHIISNEMPHVKLKRKAMKYNSDIIVDANDYMLDRVEISIDTLNNVNTVSNEPLNNMKPGNNVSSWNNNLVIAESQMGSKKLIGAKNIPRPQLTFKDPVDNSESLWVPKISDKPNNIKPLALNIIYNENGEAVGYEHPYQVEIDLYEPPQAFIDPDPTPPSFPLPMEQTRYTYIDTECQLDELVTHLSTVKEIAVDVEHHSYRTYQGITCLIQISTDEGGDFIIDTLAVREHIHKLNLSFTDPRKVKVFHGAEMDVLWLQRDFGVYIVGLFDTYQAAKALMMNKFSLKNLLMKYCQINADKQYQLADWRMRPLPDELIYYARQDTHYLLYVWRCMKAELLSAGFGSDRLLRSVFNNSKFICAATYKKNVVDDSSIISLYGRANNPLDPRQLAAFKMLYKWRDANARLLDESTSYLLPNHMLLALAKTLPREIQGVNACCNPMPPFVKQNLITIHRMLLSCREIPMETMVYPQSSNSDMPPIVPRSSNRNHNMHDLSDLSKFMKNDEIDLGNPTEIMNEIYDGNKPQLTAMVADEVENPGFVSNLNANAEMYIPPYYRYRGYHYLSQEEDTKEIEARKAKVAALAQGDPLIKAEVLDKMQVPQNALDKPAEAAAQSIQRKRKMSTNKTESKNETNAQQTGGQSSSNEDVQVNEFTSRTENLNPFNYEQANYSDLYNDRERMRKQPKMDLKKHK